MIDEKGHQEFWDAMEATRRDLFGVLGPTGSGPVVDVTPTSQNETPTGARLFGAGTQLARYKGSAPIQYWQMAGLLRGDVLDFGCGNESHDFERYDAFLYPSPAPLLKTYDTVMCNYVLNVQPHDHLVTQILLILRSVLKPDGRLLVAVVTEKALSSKGACGWRGAKDSNEWKSLIHAVFGSVKTADNSGFTGFICSK